MLRPVDLSARMDLARSVALEAGRILMSHLGHIDRVDQKTPRDLVTAADRDSEALIAARIRAAFPADALCMEESDGKEGAQRRRASIEAAPFAWCIDPLDGTTNFVHGYPVFAVSIGLLEHGRAVGGVIHAPARNETYVGGRGVPAERIDVTGRAPMAVSKNERLADSLFGVGFSPGKDQLNDATLELVRALLRQAQDVRRAGAAALDLCDVAAGRIDGFLQTDLGPWDLAAGVAIVEAAGGQVSRHDGAHHSVFAPDTVATNGRVHTALLSLVQEVR